MAYGATLTQLEAGNVYRAIVPQKIPLGGGVNGTKKPGLFKVYVPTRDGPTLEIKTSSGKVEVFAPDGTPARNARLEPVAAAANVKFELPEGQFGWFGVVVKDSTNYRVEAKLTIVGNSREKDGSMLVPWNFFYFPYTQVVNEGDRHPSVKWQKQFGGKAGDWERTSFWKSTIAGRNDGEDGHAITKEFVAEYNKYTGGDMKYEDCDWWGHCDAAASASAIFSQPSAGGNYSESDMEYFATEIAMNGYDLEGIFHLGGPGGTRASPSNKDIPEDKLGQAVDGDVGAFHEAVIQCVKKIGGVALMDMRAHMEAGKDKSSHVWNQACYKFLMEAKQARPDQPGGDEEATARQLDFKTTLTANADANPSTGNPETGNKWIRECYYVIHFDAAGKVETNHAQNNFKRCAWEQYNYTYYAPRYIFRIKGLMNGRTGSGNPHISLAQAKSIGLKLRGVFGG